MCLGCVCTNRRRCCHCRDKPPSIPQSVNHDTINDDILDSTQYNKWLGSNASQISREKYYKLTFFVDLYAWIILAGVLWGVFITHFIPILHFVYPDEYDNWLDCTYPGTNNVMSIPCIVTFHMVDVPIVVYLTFISIYILKYWSNREDDIQLFEKLVLWNNIVLLCFFIFTSSNTVQSFSGQAQWLQSYGLLISDLILLFGVIFGTYIQYQLFFYLKHIEKYEIEYPQSESDIISLVRKAYLSHGKVRVAGSKHSTVNSIYVDDVYSSNQIMISLDCYTGIEIITVEDEKTENDIEYTPYRAKVKGGTCLGLNRDNPLSTEENGLVFVLKKQGFAVADLGGIVQQSVGGFISMGCAGGSIYHDFYDSIYSIRIIDGTGTVRTYYKPSILTPDDDNEYWGIATSFGLMGIISEVIFNLKKSYNVLGSQVTYNRKDWMEKGDSVSNQDGDNTGKLNIFSNDNNDSESLYQLFMNPNNKHKTEFIRLFVWPQDEDNTLITVWKAHIEQENDSKYKEWTANYNKNKFEDIYYHQLSHGRTGVLEQKILSLMYNAFGETTNKSTNIWPQWMVKIVEIIIDEFNPTPSPQFFGADWAHTLPMDQEIHTKLLPMQFTELFFDIKDTSKVMNLVRQYWRRENNVGLKHTGTFGWELYPAKACNEWLRASYKQNSFRIDILWFDVQTDDPYDFYEPFWNLLIENNIKFRPHWSKWYPSGNVEWPIDSNKYKKWSDYYRDQFPKWEQWHKLRSKLDPENIFVTNYWQQSLDINTDNNTQIDVQLFQDEAANEIQLLLQK